jgi:SHS2 domain-containing protein
MDAGDEGFRSFDHTGDLGLEVWARTPARLFGLAAEVLGALIVDARGAEPTLDRALALEGDDAADLLVHWLNTVLLESELAGVVWTRVEVIRLTSVALEATLRGVLRDPARHVFLREVKAVSHHDVELRLDPGACRCRLVLDI